MRKFHGFSVALGLGLITLGVAGCTALDNEFGRLGAHPRSYRLEESRTTLRLLESSELVKEVKKGLDDAALDRGAIIPSTITSEDTEVFAKESVDNATQDAAFTSPGPAAAILSAGVDAVVGLISEEIKRDAERYTYSYSATQIGSGAWIRNTGSSAATQPTVKFRGFVLERHTEQGLAMRLIAVLCPTPEGKFLVRPIFIHLSRSAAKVALGDSVTLELTVSGKTVVVTEAGGKSTEADIGAFTSNLATLKLNSARCFWIQGAEHPTIGMVNMPPVPFAKDGPTTAGILQLTVGITEKDTRNHKPDRLKAAQFAEDNADQLAAIIRRALGIKKPEKEE